ncbi:para-nitrobenzyl esterase [Silvibacterium bohemicum]|uniref:Carboxylic ester hydrolase n=1 Tax=Silvibacterium bohemicum TaxID=1577686 RepID=A0A841K4B5_9BACT|nr:carboxylesterase family protein [Silvibacterium bohemicum]MBB6147407.1 para-nitrobenzyl esterase [Silvibacterium bohemicum]
MNCKYDTASWWKRCSGLEIFAMIAMVVLASLSQTVRAQETTSPAQAQQPQAGLPLSPVVQTSAGPLQGLDNHGVHEYLGIPYAQPPVGGLRWQPPQAYPQWTETRQATRFGPTCAQVTTLGAFAGPANSNEDCLYLNVFAPKQAGSEKLAVLVWIHGGGNFDGESNDYDASKLVTKGDVVVVTLNYRLGLLGWLANPALDHEGHPFGNYGLLDQQLALKWVQKNIASFGGDPTRVALGGQSAGSVDASTHVVSPLAAGLFNRAIFESILFDSISLSAGEKLGTSFSTAAGCGSGSGPDAAACLRSLPVETILKLQGTESANGPYMTTAPIADGTIVPSQGLFDAFKTGKFAHMPIMSGFTHDEYNFLLAINEYFSAPPQAPVSEADVKRYVETYGANASKVVAAYTPASYATPQLALDAMGTGSYVCPQQAVNQTLSSQVPLYAYEFNDRTAPFFFPGLPGFQSLAYHTADIQYLFPGWHGGTRGIAHPLNSAQEKLSDELVMAWANFARTGNPNAAGDELWPRFDARNPRSSFYLSEDIPALSLRSESQMSEEHRCKLWDSLQLP